MLSYIFIKMQLERMMGLHLLAKTLSYFRVRGDVKISGGIFNIGDSNQRKLPRLDVPQMQRDAQRWDGGPRLCGMYHPKLPLFFDDAPNY